MAVDSSNIYWAACSTDTATGGSVFQVPFIGGSPTTLAGGEAYTNAIASDGQFVYFGTNDGTLAKVPIGGGTVTTLISDSSLGAAADVAVDSAYVYWANESDPGSVFRIPLQGGVVETLATGQVSPYAIAVDASSVYWVNQGDGPVLGSVMQLTPK
jgi:hypothetical protein